MGYASCKSLPVVPTGYRVRYRRQILSNYDTVEVAATCIAEAYRRWPASYESLESEGESEVVFYLSRTTLNASSANFLTPDI